MGENSKEVNLDVGSMFVPKIISDILTETSMIDDFSKKSSKLDFHVHALEDEMRKIDAFKRQLPHCIYLLKDAILRLEEERLQWKKGEIGPVMEEFIPLKNDSEDGGGAKGSNDFSEKKNWMSSGQLWSTTIQYENNYFTGKNQASVLHPKSRYPEEEGGGSGSGSDSKSPACNFKNRGGAFLPFKKSSVVTVREEKRAAVSPIPSLSLSPPMADVKTIDLNLTEDYTLGRPQLQQSQQQQQQQRKLRRCWSPDLHMKFINALHQLGGAKVATPKQIRELMKVDGLTNDEVKSHLQKYRLHIRKLTTPFVGPSNYSWLTQDQCGDLSMPMVTYSGSPQGPLQHGGSGKGASANGCESMDDEEDDKSDSYGRKRRVQKLNQERL